jgi:hypothetical protein
VFREFLGEIALHGGEFDRHGAEIVAKEYGSAIFR